MRASRWSYPPILARCAALIGLVLAGSCSRSPDSVTSPPVGAAARVGHCVDLSAAIAAEEVGSDAVLELPGVTGIGAGVDRGRAVVVVFVERADVSGVPDRLDGVRVVSATTGTLRPFALTGAYRPVPIGVSVGNANDCVPGTLGCVLASGRRRYFLSANHVFARQNQAVIGEAEVQPSHPDADPACGPAPAASIVGTLAEFEPVIYDGHTPNLMDAAIAEVGMVKVTCATLPDYYGAPSATAAAATVGLAIQKVGRTTELTQGTIKAVNAKVKVTFPSGTALFTGQILTSNAFGQFGDSGSLVVTDDGSRRPVGMLIGGSNNGSGIVTPIGPILSRFGATISTN